MRSIYLVCLIALLFGSCVPQKRIVYLKSADKLPDQEYSIRNKQTRIEPFDLLYVSITNAGEQEYNFFSQEKQFINSFSEISLAVLSYTVDESGNITLPKIGKLKLQNLTLEEAASTIENAAKPYLSNPMVYVRFVNNSITILGEVNRPGTYIYSKDHITIFNAIGLSGDITEYGNRRKVTLIRESNKKINKYYLDLTKDDILKSDYYFLRPNDVVYIEPLRYRWAGMKEFPFNLIVSSVTAAFLVLYYYK